MDAHDSAADPLGYSSMLNFRLWTDTIRLPLARQQLHEVAAFGWRRPFKRVSDYLRTPYSAHPISK